MGVKLAKGSLFAIGVTLVWAVSAVASISLRDEGGAVLLMWLPSAVAVCALYVAKPGERLAVILALALGNVLLNFWLDIGPVDSLGYVVANLAEPVLIVAIAHRVIGRRKLEALRLSDMMLLFMGVLLGSVSSAVIALPFRPHQDLVQFVWWILATTLGTTIGAPVMLSLHDWLRRRRENEAPASEKLPVWFGISMLTMFLLSWLILGFSLVSLGAVVVFALVLVVTRYGQMGASTGILMFGLAGTLRSVGGHTPAAYLDFAPFEAGINLQLLMLLMMASSL
ncbi:MAG TPA: hypothetical protein VL094_04385, partial [Sphingomonadaceae bacterium]|nr:hypothetical protein [Sphingomonadaceae bacterium]